MGGERRRPPLNRNGGREIDSVSIRPDVRDTSIIPNAGLDLTMDYSSSLLSGPALSRISEVTIPHRSVPLFDNFSDTP
ncbi:hypothetical protein GCM10027294_03560 [Marinactinospora endophytica]